MNVREVQRAFRALGDAEDARNLARFFKTGPGDYGEGDRFLGIRMPVVRQCVRTYEDLSLRGIGALLKSSWHEERMLALLIMVRQFKRGDDVARRALYSLYLARTDRINNWDLVDLSAEHIVGGWLFERSRKPLYRLARSSSLWERRIAILATFHFIRQGEFTDTLAIAERLLGDRHDLIHKALGWMLREVGKRDRATGEAFLRQHYASLPRTTLRYAIERFPEPLRKRYLAGQV
jgi:3-methyladenine DNA glycosylase AlkD